MSENKTGKYLKYAIGEIILVVIGILIALSINNWNEKRKAKLQFENETQRYLLSISKDLKSDLKTIDDIINRFSKQYEAGVIVLEALESQKQKVLDSSRIGYLIGWELTDIIPNTRNENTWDGLRVRGEQAIVQDDSLISILNTFYSNFDGLVERFNQLPKKARMDLREMVSQCHNSDELNRYNEIPIVEMEFYHSSLTWECMFSIQKLHQFTSSITISSIVNRKLYAQIMNEAKSAISYLDNKLL